MDALPCDIVAAACASKRCSRCHEAKELSHFPPDRRRRDGRAGRCKACVNAAARACYASDPRKHRGYVRAYQKANPEKMRERNRHYRAANRELLDQRCQVDHMTPLGQQGSDWPWNLCLTCSTCNQRKGTKTAGEFFAVLLRERSSTVQR